MITPLGQRQILTTAALEAVRQGQEGALQAQQLLARRQATLDRMTEAYEEVPQVEGSDELRLNPNNSRQGQGGRGEGTQEEASEPESNPPEGAAPAEGRLNLLA